LSHVWKLQHSINNPKGYLWPRYFKATES
jgi:hypothetical protein